MGPPGCPDSDCRCKELIDWAGELCDICGLWLCTLAAEGVELRLCPVGGGG